MTKVSQYLCAQCSMKMACTGACAALEELVEICREQSIKDRTGRIRTLARRLDLVDAEPSRELRRMAEKIIKKYPEFWFIREWNIKIGYVLNYRKKDGERTVYGDCRKVPDSLKAYLPYDFVITFYARNTEMLSQEQLQVVMLHELTHIDLTEKGLRVKPHDIEDFKKILDEFGTNWSEYGAELPDILAGE